MSKEWREELSLLSDTAIDGLREDLARDRHRAHGVGFLGGSVGTAAVGVGMGVAAPMPPLALAGFLAGIISALLCGLIASFVLVRMDR